MYTETPNHQLSERLLDRSAPTLLIGEVICLWISDSVSSIRYIQVSVLIATEATEISVGLENIYSLYRGISMWSRPFSAK